MMKLVHVVALFFLIKTASIAQNTEGGIKFIHDKFNEALAVAGKEKKIIFLDAYTTWCGPCKMMSKNVFTNGDVAVLYNKEFVNLKMDMEKGEGPALLQRYGIAAFPTLLFLNSEGEVVHKALGYHDAEQFLTLGKTALAGENTLGKWVERYEKGEKTPGFLKEFTNILAEAYDDRRHKIAEEYLATQTDWKTPANLAFIFQHTEGVDSKLFEYLVKNQKDFEKKFTKDEISLKIQGTASEFLFNEKDVPSLSAADSVIRLVYPADKLDRMILGYRMSHYRMKGDRDNYAQAAVNFFKKYSDSEEELSETAITFYEQIDDPKMLEKAVKWAKKSVKLEKRFMNQIVVAQLYQKLGKTAKAKKEAQKAIDLAKTTGENYDEATDLLKELEEKK
ncbi:MAG: thioredoxin family protein [Saprospiraceae bacterium]|nr:thioredoxin family protein [Saprospiraceae bacterium]